MKNVLNWLRTLLASRFLRRRVREEKRRYVEKLERQREMGKLFDEPLHRRDL